MFGRPYGLPQSVAAFLRHFFGGYGGAGWGPRLSSLEGEVPREERRRGEARGENPLHRFAPPPPKGRRKGPKDQRTNVSILSFGPVPAEAEGLRAIRS